VPAILALADLDASSLSARGQSVHDALAAWQYECPTGLASANPQGAPVGDATELAESKGCLAFHVAWPRLLFGTFGDELARAGFPQPNARDEALARYLRAPQTFLGGSSYWDDVSTVGVTETSSAVVVAALNDAGAALETYLGADEGRWQWGRLHTVTLTPSDGRPLVDGPFANDGGWYTVDVANPSFAKFRAGRSGDGFTSNFAHTAGASMRLVCATASARPTEPPSCTIDLPGRQRFFSPLPAEADLMERHWLPNEPFPLRFSAADVSAAAVETVELSPAAE